MTKIFTEDMSFDIMDPDAPAIFLPSLGPNYVSYTSMYPEKMNKYTRQRPAAFTPNGTELDFFKEDNGNFYWPYGLYSAGHANLNIDNPALAEKESMLRKRDRSKTILVGDSGGYQIGKGILEFDWQNFDSPKNDELRMKILRWLENTADYSMTLDVPVWGIGNERCALKDFDDCLQKTIRNHEFFIKHRVPGATKFLNILHGRNKEETDIWYNAVKDLPFEGWAFAGASMSDFELILRRMIVMRDEGYLNENQAWIHFLGVSRIISGCAFSSLQRALRKHVCPALTISYDASSPFYSTAKGRMYTRVNYHPKTFGYTMDSAIDNKDLVGKTYPFPIRSPIGQKLTVGDLCVKGHDQDTKSSWDSYSYIFIMNHNCYMHIKGLVEANAMNLLPAKSSQDWLPTRLLAFNDLVSELFVSDKPMELIEKNYKMLNEFSGLKMSDRKLSAFDNLFSLENDHSNLGEDFEQEQDFDDDVINFDN